MSGFRIQDNAAHRLDVIYRYARDTWGCGRPRKNRQ